MYKPVVILAALAVFFVVETSCQRFILPTYRPPVTRGPVIRTARNARDEPLWLYQDRNIDRAPATGDHPTLPKYIDDIRMDPNRRYARSLGTPGRGRPAGSSNPSRGSSDTGPTHPGYNRRNARSLTLPDVTLPPFNPKPWRPRLPQIDRPERYPIYV